MVNAEEYLLEIPMWTKQKNSLEDVRAYLEAMGNPDRALKAVHVAGTNGKGSVCAFLTCALKEAGYRTGTFVSPHLEQVRERFLINGEMTDRESFERSFSTVLAVTERMVEQGKCHPTFFEFLFYMAMVLFREKQVDVVVLETGMGGRLDTTNVIESPLARVITSISLDHTQYLGDTISAIAAEKAGIIKARVPVIFDDGQPEASAVIEGRAYFLDAPRYPVGEDDFEIRGSLDDGTGFLMSARMRDGRNLDLAVPFEARYQARNAMLAVRTLEILRGTGITVDDGAVRRGIRATRWPGRMEQAAPGLYLDGAHNPGGIAAFLEAVRDVTGRREKEPYLLFAAVADKDYRSMAEAICREIPWRGIGIARMKNSRGLDTEKLAGIFRDFADCPVWEYEDAGTALHEMRKAAGEQLLFCAGSLYLIGELRECNSSDGLSS